MRKPKRPQAKNKTNQKALSYFTTSKKWWTNSFQHIIWHFVILFAFLNMKVEIHLCIWLLFLLNHRKLCPVWYAHRPSFLFLKSYTPLVGINTFFSVHCLTHCDLVMPNGDIELGQHWLRYWLVASRHQAITWTKVDLSSNGFCGIQIRANSQEVLMNLIHNMCSKITLLKSLSHFQGPMS